MAGIIMEMPSMKRCPLILEPPYSYDPKKPEKRAKIVAKERRVYRGTEYCVLAREDITYPDDLMNCIYLVRGQGSEQLVREFFWSTCCCSPGCSSYSAESLYTGETVFECAAFLEQELSTRGAVPDYTEDVYREALTSLKEMLLTADTEIERLGRQMAGLSNRLTLLDEIGEWSPLDLDAPASQEIHPVSPIGRSPSS